MDQRFSFPFCVVLLAACLGCGSSNSSLAPVSGVVTLDGDPLAGAKVSFEPISSGKSGVAGVGSYGKTDDQGRYELRTLKKEQGATIGKHRVSVSTLQAEEQPDGNYKIVQKESVPKRYQAGGELTFSVPPEGDSAANLELTSK